MNTRLQKATEEDFNFAFEAKKQAMGPHIISKWGWDENYQLTTHKQRWDEKPWFVIMGDKQRIGTISIHNKENKVRFGEFYLLDQFRNKGIGSSILKKFLRECDQDNKTVILEYLKWNPVGSLYKRSGFKVTGENEIHYFMSREPQKTLII